MKKEFLDKTIYILHGAKLNGKIEKDKLNNSNLNFIQITALEDVSEYFSCIFIFDAQLLEIASFEQWNTHLNHCISISEQHLGLDTDLLLPTNFPKIETHKLLGFACQQLLSQKQYHHVTDQLLNFEHELLNIEHQRISQLNDISIALSKEKNLGILLRKILQESQNLSDCDAVSLYLVDKQDEEKPSLLFKLSFNDTLHFKSHEFHIPINNQSIAGYSALKNQKVIIEDAYQIPADKPYKFNSSWDKKMNYRTKSILAVPITNHNHEAIGVLQFINRKSKRDIKLSNKEITERYVLPFDSTISHLLSALASQAAISIENTMLIDSINNLFEGFVQASVTAIEQRDPTTSGHSFRVADLTTTLANRLSTSDNQDYRQISYSGAEIREIRYASLLHDFGKVGVRESVLVKAKKLPENRLELLQYRFELEKERLKRKALEQELHLHHSNSPIEEINHIHKQLTLQLNKLDQYYQEILEANEPTILPDGNFSHLKHLKKTHYNELNGESGFLISDSDFLALSVQKGNLTEDERGEIQSHVVHTLDFLKQIPWTPDLSNIPTIAAAHHEKLNGQGYPYGLTSEEISIPSRMMAICDIYDALVATDRPYKNSMKLERALDIIQTEADQGLLDSDLVKIFINENVFEITSHKEYKPSMNISEPLKQNYICNIDL